LRNFRIRLVKNDSYALLTIEHRAAHGIISLLTVVTLHYYYG